MGIYVLNRTKYTKEQGKMCATEKNHTSSAHV